MPVAKFPDPSNASEDGLVAIGGDLHPQSLLLAYRSGIFPWPLSPAPDAEPPFNKQETIPLTWFSPAERGILEFRDLKVNRSLERTLRKTEYRFTINQAFSKIISHCSGLRKREGTWITREMLDAYKEFHRVGHAHSAEIWKEDRLVGGLYGVDADGAFAGESMFHLEPNTSKLALYHLIEHLKARGLDWIDIQTLTPHMEAMGAKIIPRDVFLEKLRQTRGRGLKLFP